MKGEDRGGVRKAVRAIIKSYNRDPQFNHEGILDLFEVSDKFINEVINLHRAHQSEDCIVDTMMNFE